MSRLALILRLYTVPTALEGPLHLEDGTTPLHLEDGTTEIDLEGNT